jgi:MEDS: MEthanogen/methylotroph, DcmR Sensory domain
MSASVTLGIPGLDLKVGDHVCAFYRGPERDEVLVPFLQAGLQTGDKCICVVDAAEPTDLLECLDQPLGGDCLERRQLEFFSADTTYLDGGRFVPTRMVQFWDDSVRSALDDEGYRFVRAVGEMTWALRQRPGVDQLVAYESELNRFLPRYPQVILCLYDITRFGGEIVLDMLRTHPRILLSGMVMDNPYYIEPEEFLASRR